MRSFSIPLFFIIVFFNFSVLADCSDPAGKEGEQIYNGQYKTMQFCDGATWWNMKGGSSSGGSGISIFGSKLLHVQDQKTSGTNGGDAGNNAWNVRDLSTPPLTNEITGASVASNQITLPAGTYYIEASAPAFYVYRHQLRLRTVGGTPTTILTGTSEYSAVNTSVHTRSFLTGRFTLGSSTTMELQHGTQTARLTNGLGVNSGQSLTGVAHEVYADVKIWKID